MKTLGVDLAAQPKKTAACVIDWVENEAQVITLEVGVDDPRILSLAGTMTKGTDWTGIDSPFGWPVTFSQMIAAHDAGAGAIREWEKIWQRSLCYRLTDDYVRDSVGLNPQSVSASWLAIVAMRCRGLLAELRVKDRSGVDGVVEVYPAAALRRWELIPAGFKGKKKGAGLTTLVEAVQTATPWLCLPDAEKKLCATNHHAFDAVVCALVARATALGLTERPGPDDLATARREGWIALPYPGSLSKLPNGTPGH